MENAQSGVLIHGQPGALYLHDTSSYDEFDEVAERLLVGEDGLASFIDFISLTGQVLITRPVYIGNGGAHYHANIRPRLDEEGIQARIRSDQVDPLSPFDPVSGSLHLKVVAHGIGYTHFCADWHLYEQDDDAQENNLCSWKLSHFCFLRRL